jgi:Cellulase (glycosyl hydrolase family 5)
VPAGPRQHFGQWAGGIAIALVVIVLAGVGLAIANRGGSASSLDSSPSPAARVTPVAMPASQPPVQRLTGNASTFERSGAGWSAKRATSATVSTPTHGGAKALELNGSADSTGSIEAWSPTEPATGGDRYAAAAYVRAVSHAGGAQAELRFVDASGKVTDTETGQLVINSTAKWSELPSVVGISPTGTTGVQLGVVFASAGAGAHEVIDDASIAQTHGGSSPVVGPLTVRGTQILQGNGQPLIMRGLQRFGLEGGTKNPLPTNAEIGQLKLWGANEVRISLGEQKWLATSCHFQANYPEVVDRVVHWVTSRGMVALLNLHFSSVGACGTPGLTAMADAPGSITFWQEVATRYQHNPLVAFDLFNEPHVRASVWLEGGPYFEDGQTVQAAGMQQLYRTVRGTGATNLIVVSGLDYADHPPITPLDGTNVAYGAHAYQCEGGPPPGCTTKNPYDGGVPLSHWVTFGQTHAVVVTEFGWPAGNTSTYNASVIAFAEAHGWGWSGFAWDGGTGGLFSVVQAQPASDGTTIEPNDSGMALVAGFARNTLAGRSR